jgi:hypothetical protein
MRKSVYLGAILVGVLMTGYGFLGRPYEASAADGGKNLKILPQTLTKAEIKKIMKGISESLGVQCDFCHDTDDMAKDTEHKETARGMMKMTAELNKTFFKGKDRVKCVTCHNGKSEPK